MLGYFNTQIENVILTFCVTIMKWSPPPYHGVGGVSIENWN
jgi:hypothetical protein